MTQGSRLSLLSSPLPGFEILGVLGRGGMVGIVCKAKQVDLNHFVALNVILSGDHAGG